MALWIFAALCLACAFFWAYTRGVQEATLFWGKRLGQGNEFLPPTGMQDAITPAGQNTRNITMFASLVALPILGVYQFGWAIGLGSLFGSLLLSAVLRSFLPKRDSSFFFQTIFRALASRRAKFARASDELGVEASDAVLEKLTLAFLDVTQTHSTAANVGSQRSAWASANPAFVEKLTKRLGETGFSSLTALGLRYGMFQQAGFQDPGFFGDEERLDWATEGTTLGMDRFVSFLGSMARELAKTEMENAVSDALQILNLALELVPSDIQARMSRALVGNSVASYQSQARRDAQQVLFELEKQGPHSAHRGCDFS